ncbi:putative integral plasma membrane protein [Aspergillus fischeri NRRL 181]|uniref:Integral plasma membrane protein, putative n=1 Tax=Neosartorya fischeri (strain ATCC 1020 / DSM 3700 / CBS 544.65 / FGSC A1164 / JCM 1740 / NRRL 181 / WB 181) TaxID=331117 RepID=A1D795_NEOFI|nr:integral plasma membrane protein, putative [Aspergillus fischeri NRRL 181]EAW21589.1 integral plasma membrane protein, putative [Aspergillus fischeri NRRL 181]
MAPKFKDGDAVVAINGKWVSWTHTAVAYTAFLSALVVGMSLHFHKIVQNEHYGYPDEWFPSVSATIGDRYPERSFFQVFIAITSGPRFALVFLWYLLTARPNSTLPKIVAGVGLFRTFTCGGWTYVTSTDDHDWHDIFMISYLVATLPWTLGCLALSPNNRRAVKYRKIMAGLFFGTLVPLVYYFIQHKVHKVAGAYTKYAFFEWSLILFDVGFDAVTALDFDAFEIVVRDVKGVSRGKGKPVGNTFGEGFFWSEVLDAAADVYNGYVFWSMATALGLLVWYFPLWHMGISGYEAAIIAYMSPLLLAIPTLKTAVAKYPRLFHFLSLSGLLAYKVQNPTNRLFVTTFSVACNALTWSGIFHAEKTQSSRLESRILAWGIGLIMSSVAKFACSTNNPVWPTMHAENGGWNKMGLLLGILAVLRSHRKPVPSGGDYFPSTGKKGPSLLAAFGMGGLLFAMHSLLSDSSTMISWVWEGYPVRGPIAVPHGVLTIFAMGAGLVYGLFCPRVTGSWTAFGIGSLGAALLTCYSHWTGFYGGLVLAFYVMAVAPVLVSSAARHSPATTFGLGGLVYVFLILFHVWVVAYAFVPGGPLVREHTDWLMASTMISIGAGVFSAAITNSSSPKAKTISPNGRRQRSYYVYVLAVLQLLSIAIAYLRFPTNDYTPYHKEDKVATLGIWTVHFGLDNDMWSSERRMRDVIKELEIDVIGLLESDTQRIIMGNRDISQVLAEELGMYADFGPGPNKHTWGAALLSKFPIVNSTHHLLPSPVGELAPAIHATLDMYGELVDVVVFHSGQEEDPEDRRLQSQYLAKLMGESPRPMVLLSYLVTKPLEGNYNTYVSELSGMKDIDPTDWDRWCEYILYKRLKRTGYARISRDSITDTEIQVGKFVIGEPEPENKVRIPEEMIAEGRRFPAMFRGQGVRGHRYHVFDEPRYWQ